MGYLAVLFWNQPCREWDGCGCWADQEEVEKELKSAIKAAKEATRVARAEDRK